jgi:molybdenum cofactor synthesis domain-containing protein
MRKALVSVEDAVGTVLWHDVTRIVRGRFKGPAYRRGHIIRAEDIPTLRDLGKEHVYVLELQQGDVHEDEAASRLARAVAGAGIRFSEPVESRVNLVAAHDGLLRIDVQGVGQLNALGYVSLATMHDATVVREGEVLAGVKPIPLVVTEEDVRRAEELCGARGGLVRVLPLRSLSVGVVVTGTEVATGRIQDDFGPVIRAKVEAFGSRVVRQVQVPDDAEAIAKAIRDVAGLSELVLVTGGMSVDPDDVTPAGIRQAGASIERYGAPVMPGVMLLLAYLKGKPVIGVPACALFYSVTALDLVLPRLLAGQRVTGDDIAALGHGGLCRGPDACIACTYPHCDFGKG